MHGHIPVPSKSLKWVGCTALAFQPACINAASDLADIHFLVTGINQKMVGLQQNLANPKKHLGAGDASTSELNHDLKWLV